MGHYKGRDVLKRRRARRRKEQARERARPAWADLSPMQQAILMARVSDAFDVMYRRFVVSMAQVAALCSGWTVPPPPPPASPLPAAP